MTRDRRGRLLGGGKWRERKRNKLDVLPEKQKCLNFLAFPTSAYRPAVEKEQPAGSAWKWKKKKVAVGEHGSLGGASGARRAACLRVEEDHARRHRDARARACRRQRLPLRSWRRMPSSITDLTDNFDAIETVNEE